MAMLVNMKLFDEQVSRLIESTPKFATTVLHDVSEVAKARIQHNIAQNDSVVTGTMSANVKYRTLTLGANAKSVITVSAKAKDGVTDYPYYVEFGRGPVLPKNGAYLTFQTKDGNWVRTKSVKAAPAKPFLRPAIEDTAVDFYNIADFTYRKWIAENVGS